MGSFSIALTGLQADSVALNTIGNNLANLNTTAYKGQTTSFEDLFYQQIGTAGSGDALQLGAGTKVSATTTDYTPGNIVSTTDSADMALSGNGFFVTEQDGVQSLTRAGNFQVDLSGNLTTVDGASVLGYPAVNGSINLNSAPTALQLPIGESQAAQATQNFSVTANLNAGASDGTTYSTPVTMYDSLGQSQVATVTYTKTGSNQWSYDVTLASGASTGTPVNNTGTLTFDSSGNLVSPTGNISGITFPGMSDGSSDMTLNWNLYDASGNAQIGQTTAASSETTNTQDGYPSGVYQKFSVDPSGVITATFSNGNTTEVGQLAVASVSNVEGLEVTGNNSYQATAASGTAAIGVAGAGGRGTIEDEALEQSNVDISTEFANLIVAQRAFEANSKTMTTFDTVSQDAIGMIR